MGRPTGSKNGVRCLVSKACGTCGASFSVEPHRLKSAFCSRTCADAAHAKRLFRQSNRACEACGSNFLARPADPRRYCSPACAHRVHAAKLTKPPKVHVCATCGATFVAARSSQRYCSPKCSNRSFERRIELTCGVCGKVYSARAKLHDQKTCSRVCRTIWIGKTESYLERATASALAAAGLLATPQHPFGAFVLDFAFPAERVCIECDGDYWHSRPEVVARDYRKDRYLTSHGWIVVRLSESAINDDVDGCVRRVSEALSLRTSADLGPQMTPPAFGTQS